MSLSNQEDYFMERLYFVIVDGVEQKASLVSEIDNILTVGTSTDLQVSANKDKFKCPEVGTYIYRTSQPNVFIKVVLQKESVFLVFEHELDEQYKNILQLISSKLNPQEMFKFESLLEEIHQRGYNDGCNETNYSHSMN